MNNLQGGETLYVLQRGRAYRARSGWASIEQTTAARAPASTGPSPSGSERGSRRRSAAARRSCFNGAEPIGLGAGHATKRKTWALRELQRGRAHRARSGAGVAQRRDGARVASTGPSPSGSERAQLVPHDAGVFLAASTGPSPSGSERVHERHRQHCGHLPTLQRGRAHRARSGHPEHRGGRGRRRCFNGAEPIGLGAGRPCRVLQCSSEVRASTGPSPSGSERAGSSGTGAERSRCFNGAEPIGLGAGCTGRAPEPWSTWGFNGAEPIGLGAGVVSMGSSPIQGRLQRGRAHRARSGKVSADDGTHGSKFGRFNGAEPIGLGAGSLRRSRRRR